MSGTVIFHSPPNKLRELVTKPGGKTRSEAISGATQELESVRDIADQGIQAALATLDMVVREAGAGPLDDKQLDLAVESAERLGAIATMFNLPILLRVSASLGRLGATLMDAEDRPCGPIAVHVQTARWAAENLDAAEADAESLLAGLDKVNARFAVPES